MLKKNEAGMIRLSIVKMYTSGATVVLPMYVKGEDILYVMDVSDEETPPLTEEQIKEGIIPDQGMTEIFIKGLNSPMRVTEKIEEVMFLIRNSNMGM